MKRLIAALLSCAVIIPALCGTVQAEKASPWLRQMWAAAEAKRWNKAYQETSEKARFHGVPSREIDGLATRHADYVTGKSQYPAKRVPYVTAGPGAVR